MGQYKDWRIVRLKAWRAEGRGITLCTDVKALPPSVYGHYSIMPKDVASLIKYALAHGWNPDEQGAPFWLTSADKPELDNLVITDEARLANL